jgi:hypothetical protein
MDFCPRRLSVRKLALVGALGAFVVAVPAQADKPAHPPKPAHPAPKAPDCTPHNHGFKASGTLVSSALTKNADGTYDGTITVDVKKANHKAPTGSQTYTLDDAKVKFHHGVDPLAPAAGSRVKIHGKITRLHKKCPTAGFTPTVTVKKVDINAAPKPKPEHPAKPAKPAHPAHPAKPVKP